MNAPPGVHPADETLKAYGLGKADDTTAAAVARHLETCSDCRARVSTLSADSFVNRLQTAKSPGATSLPDKSLSALGRSVQPKQSESLPQELADCVQYEEIRELGKGGMGVVYLARNKLMGRDEVLKVVNKSMLDRPGAVERFLREIQSAAKLQHPNVVAAYSALQLGELLVFAMEYVPGQDLSQVVRNADRPLPIANACYYAYQTALGLQHAHEKGMVHRDIKPSNLILTRDGKKSVVKILDFGLAKVSSEKGFEGGLTGAGKMLGTPDFMAPEQALDAAKADIRADIYSLGCTLYYLLIGRAPFAANSLLELLQHHQGTEARSVNLVRPEVPVELAGVLARMMAKDPRKRYQTPADVAQVLVPFVKTGVTAKPSAEVSLGAGETAATTGTAPVQPAVQPRRPVAKPEALPARPLPNPNPPVSDRASEDTWGTLSETSKPDPNQTVRRARAQRQVKKRRWLWPAVAGGVVLVALLAALAGSVFKVKTPDGVLIVEVSEKDSEVYVDGERVTVTWDKGGKAAEIHIKPGTRKVEVKKDGFTAFGEEVTLEDQGRQILIAKLEKAAPVAKAEGLKVPSITAEYVQLFNGKDLTGWTNEKGGAGNWQIVNGAITCSGPTDHLYTDRSDFGDFHLRAEVKVNEKGNSGIYFRTGKPLVFVGDYEAQICTRPDQQKTGSLIGLRPVRDNLVEPNTWFTYEIIAHGDDLKLLVNGKETANYKENRPNRRLIGHIALQHHDAETAVFFRKVEIKELLPTKTETNPLKPFLPPPPMVSPPLSPSKELEALSRDQIPPEALALAGDGDPKRAPASLVGVLGVAQPSHSGEVWGLAYSPDGRWLASGSLDRTIMLRDATTGRVQRILQSHTAPVISVGFSKDSRTLVSAGHDGSVRLWSVDKDEKPIIVEAKLGQPAIQAMTVSPDGRFVAVGGDSGLIKLWKWGAWEKPIEFSDLTGKVKIRSLAFSPDGELLACGGYEEKEPAPRVRIYLTADGTPKGSMPLTSKGILALSFSHEGKHVAAVAHEGNGRVWEVISGKSVLEITRSTFSGEWNNAMSVAWSPDDKKLAVGAYMRVIIYDFPDGGKRTLWFGVDQAVRSLSFCSHGDMLAAGGSHADTPVWDTTSWKLKYLERGHSRQARSVAISPDGRELLSLGDEMALLHWQLARPGDAVVRHLDFGNDIHPYLYSVSYSQDGKSTLTPGSHLIAIRNAVTEKETVIRTLPIGLANPAVSPDGRTVAGGGNDGYLHIWDLALGRDVHHFPTKGRWCSLAFSHDGKLLASCNEEAKRVTIWTVATGAEGSSWEVKSVARVSAFSPESQIVATGHDDGSILLWDTATSQMKRALAGHSAPIRSLKFTPDGKTLVSSGNDGIIRLWDPENVRAREVIPLGPAKRPLSFDLDPSGKYLFATGSFPVIFVLRLPNGGPLTKAKIDPDRTVALDPDRIAAKYVLSIGGTIRLNDEARDIKLVAELPGEVFRLTYVDTHANNKVSDESLANFKSCKNISTLILGQNHQLGDAGLVNFKDCKNLIFLNLTGTNVTDEGLANFQGNSKLTDLYLGGTKVSDAGMVHFQNCKKLKSLDLNLTKVTDAGLKYFKGCTDLYALRLEATIVTDEGLANFGECKNLIHIFAARTGASDKGVEYLANGKKLEILKLDSTKVTDKGLEHLRECKFLRILELRGTSVTAVGIEALKKALPECRVEWNAPK